jgi:hypothetical protein
VNWASMGGDNGNGKLSERCSTERVSGNAVQREVADGVYASPLRDRCESVKQRVFEC